MGAERDSLTQALSPGNSNSSRGSHPSYAATTVAVGLPDPFSNDADGSTGGFRPTDSDGVPPASPLLPGCAVGEPSTRKLGIAQMVGIVYFAVCGGPYGIESAVGAAGPFYTLLSLLIIPWIWSLPQALMTAELSSMMPEDGGYIIWVERGMGPFWGFLNAWLNFLCNLSDNALYPLMFTDYLSYVVPALDGDTGDPFVRWAAAIGMILAVTALNLRGLDLVGWSAFVFGIIVLVPFAILIGAGAGDVIHPPDPHPWGVSPPLKSVNWGVWYSVVLWNLSGFASGGTVAGSVADPKKTYPWAMVLSLVLIQMTYLLPVAVGVCVDPNWRNWTDGYFTHVGVQASDGGHWLATVFSIGGAASALGMLNTLLATTSHAAFGMAMLGYLPERFTRRMEKNHIPHHAIVLHAVAAAGLCWFDFDQIVQVSNLFATLCTLLQWVALLMLRLYEPHASRPYQIPLRMKGLVCFVTFPFVMTVLNLVLVGWWAWAITGSCIIAIVIMYYVLDRTQMLNVCCMLNSSPHPRRRAFSSFNTPYGLGTG